jgi:hypothetical protein
MFSIARTTTQINNMNRGLSLLTLADSLYGSRGDTVVAIYALTIAGVGGHDNFTEPSNESNK